MNYSGKMEGSAVTYNNVNVDGRPPPDVLQVWKDVTYYSLVKDNTIVWTKAIESLQHAHHYLHTSAEARTFIDEFMAQLIALLLEKYSEIIDQKEKECVKKTLCLTLQIVKDDLEAKCHEHDDDIWEECATLDALIPVFNEKNTELRIYMILFFRRIRGFRGLAEYMNARVSSHHFPEMDVVKSLLRAVRESIPDSDINKNTQDQEGEEIDTRDDAMQISREVMNHLIGLENEKLEQIGPNLLRLVRWQLFRLYLRLCDSSFFIFWRSLALKLVTSQRVPLILFGWAEIVGIIKESKNLYLSPPRSYIVSGAGKEFVNGRYDFDPKFSIMENGQLEPSAEPIYHKRIQKDGGDVKTLTIFKCTMRSQAGKKWWFVSEADADQPGTERDIDFYQYKSKQNEAELPPHSGWLTCPAGTDPSPILEPISLKVPAGEESNTLEHQLVRWAIENEVIDLVFAEPINSKIVASSTELVKFLAKRTHDGDDPTKAPDRISPQIQADTMFLNIFLVKAWKTCSGTSDAELSAQISQLLVSVVPTLSDEMAIFLFTAIRDSLGLSNKCKNDDVSGFCRNIDVLTDVNINNSTLVELARQIKMMVS